MAAIDKEYPIVIGVSEVENRNVLEDIVATPKLAPGNYRISHFDSPEARGVDVASSTVRMYSNWKDNIL